MGVTCPLCGYEYDEQSLACQSSCAMNCRCAILCCPQCGYQMVDEHKSTTAGWLRRLLKRDAGPTRISAGGVKSLADLAPGQSGEVVTIASKQSSRLDRLSALGVVPGSQITLVQRTPAFILRVGETELTVDESIAQEILTRA